MFYPKNWNRDTGTQIAFVPATKIKWAEILVINPLGLLQIKRVHIIELDFMTDISYGARQERVMKTTLRRLGRKKGTTRKARAALQEILK